MAQMSGGGPEHASGLVSATSALLPISESDRISFQIYAIPSVTVPAEVENLAPINIKKDFYDASPIGSIYAIKR